MSILCLLCWSIASAILVYAVRQEEDFHQLDLVSAAASAAEQLSDGTEQGLLDKLQKRPKKAKWVSPEDQEFNKLISGLEPECEKEIQGVRKRLMDECVKTWKKLYCLEDLLKIFTGENLDSDMSWFTSLATSKKEAVLWSGFWDGEGAEEGRTSKRALLDFADLVDKDVVHPSTELGKIASENNNLQHCSQDLNATRRRDDTEYMYDRGLLPNFWARASEAFVEAMAERKQSSVVIMVNKDIKFNAKDQSFWCFFRLSVLGRYELPALGKEIRKSGWRPQLVVVDLKGSCKEMQPEIEKGLADNLLGKDRIQDWLKHKPMICMSCTSPCKLNKEFAEELRRKVGWSK